MTRTGTGGRPRESAHRTSFRTVVCELADYEPGKAVEDVAEEFGLPVESIVKLASNECPFGPSPAAVAAIPTEFPNLHLYPWKRFSDFKEVLGAFHGVSAQNVVLGNGSESLISMIPQLYIDPGDEVVVATEGYPLHELASLTMGATVRRVPLGAFRYDVDAILSAVDQRTKIVWLCSPNNPTGTIVRFAEVKKLLDALPPTVAIVMDGAYAEFVDDPEYGDAVSFVREGHPNVIALRTLSKAYGLAGLRIGYVIADAEVCNMLDRVREPFNMSRAATAAGPVALRDQEWLRRCQAFNRAGRSYLTDELMRLGFAVVPSEANFILFAVGPHAHELYERLLRRGIIVRPTAGFGYPEHLRVTVGTEEQNRLFIAALEELASDHISPPPTRSGSFGAAEPADRR